MSTPLPGKKVRGSTTGRPLMALLDLLGRRWTLRIIWELRTNRRLNFRELQEICGISSPSVLTKRLGELRENGFVGHTRIDGYYLTAAGSELLDNLKPLQRSANKWEQRLKNKKKKS